jgi:hypothetical protein
MTTMRSLNALLLVVLLVVPAACSSESPPPTADQSQVKKDLTGIDQPAATLDGPKPTADGPKPTADGPKPTADGPKPPTPDSKKPTPDFPTKYDGATGITCAQIGDCSDKCAAGCGSGGILCLMGCSNTCKAKGCASAQTAFGTLYNCVNVSCAIACLSGPNAACKTCVQDKCTTQLKACDAQSC